MKEQILKIAKQLENEEINEFEARGELLFLFGVRNSFCGCGNEKHQRIDVDIIKCMNCGVKLEQTDC
jgi:hypothetical protein